jgi:hypothetical protein
VWSYYLSGFKTNYSSWRRRRCYLCLELVRWLSSTHKTRSCDGYQVCILREPASIITCPSLQWGLSFHIQNCFSSAVFYVKLLSHATLLSSWRNDTHTFWWTRVPLNMLSNLSRQEIKAGRRKVFEREGKRSSARTFIFLRIIHISRYYSRSETPGKYWNVVLEKDGEDQLDRSCEKWRSVT